MIKPILPWPPNQGTKRVTLALLKALSVEHEVTLVAPVFSRSAAADARAVEDATGCRVITRLAPNRRSVFHRAWYKALFAMQSWLGGHSPRALYSSPGALIEAAQNLSQSPEPPFDLAIFEYWYSYRYINRVNARKRVLLAHDAEFSVNRLAASGGTGHDSRGRRIWAQNEARREIEACRLVDQVWTLTDVDGDLLAQASRLERGRFVTLPFGVDTRTLEIPDDAGDAVLFFGAFAADFNRSALIYLLEEIWPRVRKANPSARLVVAGGGLPANLQFRVRSAAAEYRGEVADVRSLYALAAVVVIPLRFGGGLRIRLLEALACSRAVVATPVAVGGMRGSDGKHYIVRENPEGLAAAIVELLANPRERARLGGTGRLLVLEHYSEEKAASEIRRMARQVVTGN